MTPQESDMDEASTPVRAQYHHFIPQFILKNFSHKYVPPKGKTKGRRPRKQGQKLFKDDPALNHVELTADKPEITESPVKRILGMPDMYRDTTKPAKQQQMVEEMFSRLESKVSHIYRRITTAFDKGDDGIWLTRDERNMIRKFGFLMKYRGSTFHRRFYHEAGADYEANDRHILLKYMKEHGFSRPLDVWFHNIKSVIEVDMDNELKWLSELPEKMYPDDARWAIMTMQSMFMSICATPTPDCEFILTDNSYSIYEGPTNVGVDQRTGELVDMGWVNFHEFAPISPRLMIVLRSFLLPDPLEDASPEVKAWRDDYRQKSVDDFFRKDARSMLHDLDIRKADNNYSAVIGGRRYRIDSEDWSPRSSHKFFFRFFRISERHVHIINGIFFDNASHCTSLVFNTRDSFLSTLEFYMESTTLFNKAATSIPGDRRLILLKKLAVLMTSMGSAKIPIWPEVPPAGVSSPTKLMEAWDTFVKIFSSRLEALKDDSPTEFNQIRRRLGKQGQILTLKDVTNAGRDAGGTLRNVVIDMEQAERMAKFRVKIDVWSQGVSEDIRSRNRSIVDAMLLDMPRHRYWLYIKFMRYRAPESTPNAMNTELMKRKLRGEESSSGLDAFSGPEDVVALGQFSSMVHRVLC